MVFDRLEAVEQHYEELGRLMSDPDMVSDYTKMQEYGRERSDNEEVVNTYREFKAALSARDDANSIIAEGGDPEMTALAQEEVERLNSHLEELESRLKLLLLPRDKDDDRNVIIEIRAGAGGDEAALFAAELYRMYARYAAMQGWKVDVVSSSEAGVGGFKEIVFEVAGKGAYSQLKFESGVHRVQRVPVTEANGRIHTSTASVIVMPEAEEVDVEIKPEDIRVDIYRASGHGGQGVNTTDSAIRITHYPTGLVVTCQDERSQIKNRAKAMTELRTRLYDLRQREQAEADSAVRKSQVASADRSEKVRTYNFPQDRVTDHRINLSLSNLPGFMAGNIGRMIESLQVEDQTERLRLAGVA
jgi:peptide chain release factor 1